ncbi:MAG: phosphoglycerate dehydrogenase [Bacteroidia bacterium]
MTSKLSFPKHKIKVLLLENIHPNAQSLFEKEGYQVETVDRALSEDELCEKIKDVFVIGIRSKTHITRKVLAHANRLMAVGAFCIGTNQIDLDACAEHGVVAFNAPFSNTRSVVELALGEMIMLTRRIPFMSEGMHIGRWDKSAKESYEIRGKKLGIIGYGNIGAQLSVLAEALGMRVYYYDLVEKLALGNARKMDSLEALLNEVDVLTLHVDGRTDNKMIFGEKEFSQMKPGSIFINLSRGFVVQIEALKAALKSGHLRGAAVDVFPQEPKSNAEEFISELRGIPNVILTPHIGGSTQEAQRNIAEYVPARIVDYVNAGTTFNSVNFPALQLPSLHDAHRLIHLHRNQPGILAKINNILAHHDINIVGQYLKTDENVGYVITDVNRASDETLQAAMRDIDGTIRFRVLY